MAHEPLVPASRRAVRFQQPSICEGKEALCDLSAVALCVVIGVPIADKVAVRNFVNGAVRDSLNADRGWDVAEQGGVVADKFVSKGEADDVRRCVFVDMRVLKNSRFDPSCKSRSQVLPGEEALFGISPPGSVFFEKQPFYAVEDSFPYGHGEKSVFLIERFMRLKIEEAMAIRWHMGGFEDSNGFTVSLAYEKYPLAVKLHLADLESTYLREKGTSAVNKR